MLFMVSSTNLVVVLVLVGACLWERDLCVEVRRIMSVSARSAASALPYVWNFLPPPRNTPHRIRSQHHHRGEGRSASSRPAGFDSRYSRAALRKGVSRRMNSRILSARVSNRANAGLRPRPSQQEPTGRCSMTIRSLSIVVLAFFALAVTGLAQTTSARIEGIVQDQTSAVVPNAKITIVHVQTQVKSETTSDRKSTRLNSSHLVISYAVF